MVDLAQLEATASEHADVRRFLSQATALKVVRGITVRPLPHWKLLHYGLNMMDGALAAGLPDGHSLQMQYFEHLDLQFAAMSERADRSPHFNLGSAPKSWDDVAKRYFSNRSAAARTPLLLTAMIHRDPLGKDEEEVDALRNIVETCSLPAIVETNHDARLQFAAGDGILAGGATGVTGGFLRDAQNYDTYAVTCAHVAPLNSTVTDVAGQPIGTSAAATSLAMNSGNLACDPLAVSGAAPINRLDAALVHVSNAVPATGTKLAGSLRHSQTIDVQRTGVPIRRFQIRSLAISFQLLHTHGGKSDRYCFENLVELYSRTTVTQASDSGSWGYTLGGDWATMVIGGDQTSSFAVRASHVLDWARNTAFGRYRGLSVH